MLSASVLTISSVTMLEARMVLYSRHGTEAVRELDEMIENTGVIVVAFDRILGDAAFEAFRRYGKGQGHPAQLNIIDCAAYALAKVRSEPLLFKGTDFANTDIIPAL